MYFFVFMIYFFTDDRNLLVCDNFMRFFADRNYIVIAQIKMSDNMVYFVLK